MMMNPNVILIIIINNNERHIKRLINFFLPPTDRGMSYGFDNETATFLVSTIGITNTIGRIVCGTSTSLPGVDALVVNNVLISISGIATIISALSHSKGYQFFYAAIYGSSVC